MDGAAVVRMVAWHVKGGVDRWQRVVRLAGTLAADVVCIQGVSGWAADGRLESLGRTMSMSPHVACDPAGGDVVIFTGERVDVREFLLYPTAVAAVRIDGWKLTVATTLLGSANAVTRLRLVRTLSSLAGDVALCGGFDGVGPVLTDAGFRDAALVAGAIEGDHVWLTPGVADRLVGYTMTGRDAWRTVSENCPITVTLLRPA